MRDSPGPSVEHVTLDDIDVAFCRSGSGRRLVLIHGLAQDHRIWSGIQDQLGDFLTFAYDVRGHGATRVGHADGTLAQLSGDLVKFLEEVGPSVCVGFSLGGSIALRASTDRPDLVTGVVAVATSSIVGRAAEAGLRERIEVVSSGDVDRIRIMLHEDTLSQLAESTEAEVDRLTEERLAAIADPRGYLNAAQAVCSMRVDSLHDRLQGLEVPVLITSGEFDAWCPRRASDIMREQIPAATFLEIHGVGHLVTDEDPDGLVDAIRSWTNSSIPACQGECP